MLTPAPDRGLFQPPATVIPPRAAFTIIATIALLLSLSGCGDFFENHPRAVPQSHSAAPATSILPENPAASPSTAPEPNESPKPATPPATPPNSPTPEPPSPPPLIGEPPPKPAVISHPKINLEAERRNLLEADSVFSRASEDQGAPEAFYDHLTPDALLLLPGEVPIKGIDAIKVHLTVNRPGLFIWRARDGKVAESADLGYTWGNYELRSYNLDTRNPPIRYGKYLMVWKKQLDGLWKATVISASPSPPPTERR